MSFRKTRDMYSGMQSHTHNDTQTYTHTHTHAHTHTHMYALIELVAKRGIMVIDANFEAAES